MSSSKTATIRVNVAGSSKGYTVIDSASSLTRLNYFDGKFLRAPDLQLEQAALLNQVRLSNQAAGGGVVHGFDCTLAAGDKIQIGAGLAFDWQGRALMLGQDLQIAISDLVKIDSTALSEQARTKQPTALGSKDSLFKECEIKANPLTPDNILANDELYLIVVSHIEAYCGEEDVYGKICSEACISDTQRTHIVEGIQISAVPLNLSEPLKSSEQVTLTQKHLRSRTISAYFAQEKSQVSSLISQQGLSANTWCLGAEAKSGQGIAIGILSKVGNSVVFLDAWGARRERMDPPPKQYWAARMGMRSWHIYLAQILQFQCQLRDCLGSFDPENPPVTGDPCADEKTLIKTAASDMQQLLSYYTEVSTKLTQIERIPTAKMATFDVSALRASIGRLQAAGTSRISQQLLIDCGIVEIPSAGYLPVVADSALTINAQVRQLMGNGVNLRFCSVRADYVHHALEEAQHMDRICLLSGLDDAANRQEVDILVPEGVINQLQNQAPLPGFQASLGSSDIYGQMFKLVQSRFDSGLAEKGLSDDFVTRNALSAKAGNIPEIIVSRDRESERDPQSDTNMTGSARADTDGQSKAFYVAASNTFSNTFGNSKINFDVNFWAEMQANKDVFSASRNDRIQVSSRVLMETSEEVEQVGTNQSLKNDALIGLTISGQLVVENIAQQGNSRTIDGRFIGDGTLQFTTNTNGIPKTQISAFRLNDDIQLTKIAKQTGADIIIKIPRASLFGDSLPVDIEYKQTWNAAGECEVLGVLSISSDKGTKQQNFLSGKFTPDDDALKAGNPFYEKSLIALNQIAGALNNNSFVESSSHLLFPPPKAVPDELTVRGSYPWVLFHRRRDKNCQGSKIPEPVATARRYQIYYVAVDQGVNIEKLIGSIDSAFDSAVAGAKPVAIAEFAANSQILNSAHQQLRQAWTSTVDSDTQVIVAVVASQGEVLSEGASIAKARLKSTTTVLDQVADINGGLPVIVKQALPVSLLDAEIDGAIVYFVQQVQVNTDCHAIYQVLTENPDQIARQLKEAIEKYKSGSTDLTLDNVFNNDNAQRLNINPQFVADTGNFASEQQAEKFKSVWIESGDYRVTHAGALHAEEKPQSANSTLQQTESIVGITGFISDDKDDNMETIAVPSGMLGDCQRASILLSATQCHDVYLVAFAGRDNVLIEGQQVTEAQRAALDVILVAANTGWGRNQVVYYQLNPLSFYRNSNQTVIRSQQLFDEQWQAHLAANDALRSTISVAPRIDFYSVVQQTINNEGNPQFNPDGEQVKAQNSALAELMNTNRPTTNFGIESNRDSFPSSCPVITFVIIDPAQQETDFGNDFGFVVRFNDNNEVIRDTKLEAAANQLISESAKVEGIEMISVDAKPESQKVAELQGKEVKKVLQEKEIATRLTKVTSRAPTKEDKKNGRKLTLLIKK